MEKDNETVKKGRGMLEIV